MYGWSVCQKCKKGEKWGNQPKYAKTNCFDGGMDLRTFSIPVFFVFVSVSLSFTKFLKERQKAVLDSVIKTCLQGLFLHIHDQTR